MSGELTQETPSQQELMDLQEWAVRLQQNLEEKFNQRMGKSLELLIYSYEELVVKNNACKCAITKVDISQELTKGDI